MLSPYMSKTFLSIVVVPNKADFCTIPTFSLIPSVSIHPLKPLLMHPRAPTTTGTTSTFFSDQNLFSSLFKFWYISIFSISFSHILQSPGIATSMMTHDFAFLSTKIKSSLLASVTLSRLDIYIPDKFNIIIFHSSFRALLVPLLFAFKVMFLAQFPMNQFCNCVMSSLILTLR